MAYEKNIFPSILSDKEVLEWTKMSEALADKDSPGNITNSDLADASVGRSKLIGGAVDGYILADDSVDFRHLKNESIGASKYVPRSVGTGTLADNAVRSAKIADGAVEPRHLSFSELNKNEGVVYPLINYPDSNGAFPNITDKVKNTILDAKVMGASSDRLYRIDSVRYGLSDTFG